MTKTNQTKQTAADRNNAAAIAAADELTAARENAVAAFKSAAKSAATQTTAALQFVAAYYGAKKTIIIDKDTRADLRKSWKDAGNSQKYESAVFYRVLKTCEKNAAIVAAAFENDKDGKDAAQAARDALLAAGVGLTSCKAAEDSKESATKDAAPTKQATTAATKESAAERLKTVLDYVASCGDSAFAAIAAAVEKRRAVSEKRAKAG